MSGSGSDPANAGRKEQAEPDGMQLRGETMGLGLDHVVMALKEWGQR
jgi:hypothetical protein